MVEAVVPLATCNSFGSEEAEGQRNMQESTSEPIRATPT